MDWMAVFKAGTHTDSVGNQKTWTGQDLDNIVSKYDPQKHEAPVVIGHPKDNAPAFGWIEALKREGDTLFAKAKDLQPAFVDMVKQGLFKKRSIALYPDSSLRHIGFLGAMPPAIKGLPDVAFNTGEQVSIIEFAAPDAEKQAQMARSQKYGIAVKEGGNITKPSEWAGVPDDEFMDPVNYRYPCPNADQTRAAARYWGKAENKAQYSPEEQAMMTRRMQAMMKKFKIGDNANMGGMHMSFKEKLKGIFTKAIDEMPDEEIPPLREDHTYSESEVANKVKAAAEEAAKKAKLEAQNEFAEQRRQERLESRKGEIKTWSERMCKEGKLTPALIKFGIPEILMAFAESETVIEFGETKEKASCYDRLKALFETQMPKMITFKEVAARDGEIGGQTGAAGEKLDALTKKKMVELKSDYARAYSEVKKEFPELYKEYTEEITTA